MKIFGTALGTVFGLGVLIALLAGAYFLFDYVLNVFAILEPQTRTLAAIASVVAVLCSVIIAEGIKAHGRGDDRLPASGKAEIYERLLAICCSRTVRQSIPDEPESYTEIVKTERLLALYGNTKVISAYVGFRKQAKENGKPEDGLVLLRKLAIEMRGDLGQGQFVRSPDDLLDLLLKPH